MIYLPEYEKERLLEVLYGLVENKWKEAGFYPLGLSIRLPKDDLGGPPEINFLLGKEQGVLIYESVEQVEMDGIPGRKLRVPAERPGDRVRRGFGQ